MGWKQSDYCQSPVGKTAIMDNDVEVLGGAPDIRIYV